jgi:ABC-type tungstate transport system permease subunit
MVLSTTTSTYDSGLLDYLIPVFQDKYNVEVRILSKGTGESIEIAKRGDADVVLVHARSLEEPFVNDGYGVHRVGVMYNDFIIIGPNDDPAGIAGTICIEEVSRLGGLFVCLTSHDLLIQGLKKDRWSWRKRLRSPVVRGRPVCCSVPF